MIQGNFAVTIDNIRTSLTTDSSTWGYTSDAVSGKGQFDWKVKDSTTHTGYTSGILAEKWATGFSKSIDIRRKGGVANIGGGTLTVNNVSGFYQWMEDNGVKISGSRIRLKQLTGTTTETTIYTGVISSLSYDSTTVKITYEDTGKYRNEIISKQFGEESSNVYPVVFGESEKTKFVNTVNSNEEYLFSNGSILFQCIGSAPDANLIGIKYTIKPSKDLLYSDVYLGLEVLIASGKCFIKSVSGSGSDIIRKVESITSTGRPIVSEIEFVLTGSAPVMDGTSEWKDTSGSETTYFKFYSSEYINSSDIWENCKGFQDENLYAYTDNGYGYVNVPNDGSFINISGGKISGSDSQIILDSNILVGDAKISGYLISPFNVPSVNRDDLPTPNELGISGTWTAGDGTTNGYTTGYYPGKSTSPTLTPENAVDGVYTSFYNENCTSDISVQGSSCYIMHCEGTEVVGDSLYIGLAGTFYARGRDFNSVQPLDVGSYVKVIGYNNFGGFQLASKPIQTTSTNFNCEFMNFKDDYLQTYNPISKLTNDRSWDSEYLRLADVNDVWYTGKNTIEITEVDGFPLIGSLGFYIVFILKLPSVTSPTDRWFNMMCNIRELEIIQKLTDIDFTKGLYAKWWGREFSSTDFGSSSTALITKSQDILNHVLRLQNYEQDALTPPTEGWGLNYLDGEDYSTVINNTTSYGGLQYSGFESIECSSQLETISQVNINNIKRELCRESWLISATNNLGQECMYPMEEAFNTEATRVNISLYNAMDRKISISDRPATDIFCTPYVQYNLDPGSGKYLNKLSITNPEAATWDASYVTGVSDPAKAEDLWNKAKSLYEKYLIKNEVPTAMTKLNWVTNEISAMYYLDSWLEWMGGTEEGFIDRREVSMKLPYEFARSNNFDIGSLISIDLPFVSSSITLNGIIKSVNYSLNTEKPTCTISAFVELRNTDTGDKLLLENGDYILQENDRFILL